MRISPIQLEAFLEQLKKIIQEVQKQEHRRELLKSQADTLARQLQIKIDWDQYTITDKSN